MLTRTHTHKHTQGARTNTQELHESRQKQRFVLVWMFTNDFSLILKVLFVVDSSSIGWLMHFNFTFDFWLAKILGSPSLFRTERHNFRFTYTRRSLEFRCYFSVWPSIFPAIRAAFRPYAAAILYSRCERALSAVLLA